MFILFIIQGASLIQIITTVMTEHTFGISYVVVVGVLLSQQMQNVPLEVKQASGMTIKQLITPLLFELSSMNLNNSLLWSTVAFFFRKVFDFMPRDFCMRGFVAL